MLKKSATTPQDGVQDVKDPITKSGKEKVTPSTDEKCKGLGKEAALEGSREGVPH